MWRIGLAVVLAFDRRRVGRAGGQGHDVLKDCARSISDERMQAGRHDAS